MMRSKKSTPSKESCRICGSSDQNRQWTFGFRYTLCVTHREVPPARLDEAKQQYVRHRRTEWDAGRPDDGRADPSPEGPASDYGGVPGGMGITKRPRFFDV